MNIEILNRAIEHFGEDSQKTKAVEEMAELTKEICKDLSGYGDLHNIIEETADAMIMLKQIILIYGIQKQVDELIDFKTDRLEKKIENEH